MYEPGANVIVKRKMKKNTKLAIQPSRFKFLKTDNPLKSFSFKGARCSSVVRAFARGAMGGRIDPSWGEPIELFLVVCAILSVGWCI